MGEKPRLHALDQYRFPTLLLTNLVRAPQFDLGSESRPGGMNAWSMILETTTCILCRLDRLMPKVTKCDPRTALYFSLSP